MTLPAAERALLRESDPPLVLKDDPDNTANESRGRRLGGSPAARPGSQHSPKTAVSIAAAAEAGRTTRPAPAAAVGDREHERGG
ncbi:hypothetical protein GCM10010399_43370 [Dactylosporangium fulvum]